MKDERKRLNNNVDLVNLACVLIIGRLSRESCMTMRANTEKK